MPKTVLSFDKIGTDQHDFNPCSKAISLYSSQDFSLLISETITGLLVNAAVGQEPELSNMGKLLMDKAYGLGNDGAASKMR